MRKSIGTHIKLLLSFYPSLHHKDHFILIQTPLLKQLPVVDDVVLSVSCERTLKWITDPILKSMNQV